MIQDTVKCLSKTEGLSCSRCDGSIVVSRLTQMLYMLCKVHHQDTSYRGFTSVSSCPAFAKDFECNGKGTKGVDSQHQHQAAQVSGCWAHDYCKIP